MTGENKNVYARYVAALSRLPITEPTEEDLEDLCPYATSAEVMEALKEFGRIACPPTVAGELQVLEGEFKDRLFGILGHKLVLVRKVSVGCLDDVPFQERAEDFANDNWVEKLGDNQSVNEEHAANVKFDAERMEDLNRKAARKGVKMSVFEADQGSNYDPSRRYGMHIDQGPDLPTIILWAATWHLLMDDGGSRLDDLGNGGIVANDISSENIPAEADEESSSFEDSDNDERGSGIGDSDTDNDPGDSGFDSGDSGFDGGGF